MTLGKARMSESEPPDTRPNSLRDAYEAAKRKTEYQTEVMEALDNKALRIFRYAVLVAGLIVTGLSAGRLQSLYSPGSNFDVFLGALGLVGVILGFLGATIFSLMAARVSNLDYGPSEEDIKNVLSDQPNEGEWLESTLKRQSDYIRENRGEINADQKHLIRSQIAFLVMFVGLFFIFWGWV